MMPLFEIQSKMSRLKNWALQEGSIVKDKRFRNFKDAIEFINKVAEIAERKDHHPTLLINYNVIRMTLTTHSANGLTQKDFDVAEEIDKL